MTLAGFVRKWLRPTPSTPWPINADGSVAVDRLRCERTDFLCHVTDCCCGGCATCAKWRELTSEARP